MERYFHVLPDEGELALTRQGLAQSVMTNPRPILQRPPCFGVYVVDFLSMGAGQLHFTTPPIDVAAHPALAAYSANSVAAVTRLQRQTFVLNLQYLLPPIQAEEALDLKYPCMDHLI